MRIAITGHTSGIGKELSNLYTDVIGFSRTNGFDLRLRANRQRMFLTIQDCDIFINNADLGWEQTTLLYELWEQWKDKEKLIVNIGSDAADYNPNFARPYNVQKRALQDACLQLQQAYQPCKVMLVKPGYIDTPRVQQINATKMDPTEVALYIKDLTEMKNRTLWTPIVTLYPR
jgi:NAD(P)-dependent dehydrogenase (short-subunit alcohol dehydrogenase family)